MCEENFDPQFLSLCPPATAGQKIVGKDGTIYEVYVDPVTGKKYKKYVTLVIVLLFENGKKWSHKFCHRFFPKFLKYFFFIVYDIDNEIFYHWKDLQILA